MSDAISKTKVLECIGNAINKIVNMPTTHDNARETHACDLISRRATIEAIDYVNWYHPGINGKMFHGASDHGEAWFRANDIYDVIEKLPSAEPERAQFGPDCHLVWQYCTDPNDVMKAVMEKDENWEGLYSPEQIISIVYDSNHKSYVVFWIAKW